MARRFSSEPIIFAGTAVIGAGIGTSSSLLIAHVASAGDILGFLGALSGSAIGVMGAFWSVDHARRRAEDASVEIIRDALRELRVALENVRLTKADLPDDEGDHIGARLMIRFALEGLADAMTLLEAATSTPLPRFGDRKAVLKIARELPAYREMFEHEARVTEAAFPLTVSVLGIFRQKVEVITDDLISVIDETLRHLSVS